LIITGRTGENEIDQTSANLLILKHGVDIEGTQTFASVDSTLPRKPHLKKLPEIGVHCVTDDPKTTDDEIAMTIIKKTLKFDQNRY